MIDERVGPCGEHCAVVDECDARGREITRLNAENEKLRAELEAIKSPPDYGTQKTMNEQLHYASVIAQKDREIERLRAAADALKETGDD